MAKRKGLKVGKRLRWALALIFVTIVLAFLDYHLYPRYIGIGGESLNHGENGLWLRYTWYFGEKKESDYPALAARLKANGIRYAYFHVRFVLRNGDLKFRNLVQARELNRRVGELAPGVKRLAWVYAGNTRLDGNIDLMNPSVRKRMVAEAVWLVQDCGFDGVQWDYEICSDGEPGLLRLLEETRAALPKGALLGAAVPAWLPFPMSSYGWSEPYFAEVAKRCDQMALMVYDSGMYMPRSYVWLMREQCTRVTPVVARANPQCRVLLGIPTYTEGAISHNSRSENIRMALKGVREGMASPGADKSVFAGVALFADYTTDSQEWETFRRFWNKKGTADAVPSRR